MQPHIQTIPEKKLIGKRITMSMADNRTGELWRSFMPLRNGIPNAIGGDLISMQVYPDTYSFSHFNPAATFDKWAVVEVSDFNTVSEGMEIFTLPAGLYAVFTYKGNPINAAPFFQYIFGTWFPASEYELDTRPHFEILGEKYRNNDDSSEEEVWIPVRPK